MRCASSSARLTRQRHRRRSAAALPAAHNSMPQRRTGMASKRFMPPVMPKRRNHTRF
jgi:hypothetical protein